MFWTKEELDLFSDEELDKLIEEVQALANKNYKEKHAEKVRKEFEETQRTKALAEEKAQKAKAKAEKEKRQQEEARKKAAAEAKEEIKKKMTNTAVDTATKLLINQERKKLIIDSMRKTAPSQQPVDERALNEQLRSEIG